MYRALRRQPRTTACPCLPAAVTSHIAAPDAPRIPIARSPAGTRTRVFSALRGILGSAHTPMHESNRQTQAGTVGVGLARLGAILKVLEFRKWISDSA